jgi:plastocyanin
MEDQATSTESSAKKGMSPAIIIGIIGLIIIVGAGAFFMSKKNSSTMAPQTTTQQPTQAMSKEESMENKETSPSGAMMMKESEKAFEVDGSNFKFSPSTLTVNEGDTVKITFKNTQGFHNFIIDEFNAKSKTIQANQTDELTFVANKKGTFEFYCGVGNHRAMGMKGTLTVK